MVDMLIAFLSQFTETIVGLGIPGTFTHTPLWDLKNSRTFLLISANLKVRFIKKFNYVGEPSVVISAAKNKFSIKYQMVNTVLCW